MTATADDQAAASLVAQIVQMNADQAAHTADILIEMQRGDKIRFAEALVELANAVDAIPVVDRRLLDILDNGKISGSIAAAERVLQEEVAS